MKTLNRIEMLIVLFVAVFCGGIVSASAAPFLVCDPHATAETYTIYQDGAEFVAGVQSEEDGSLKYDLSGIEPGAYEFTVKACNVWGCSNGSNPFVSPDVAAAATGLQMTQ